MVIRCVTSQRYLDSEVETLLSKSMARLATTLILTALLCSAVAQKPAQPLMKPGKPVPVPQAPPSNAAPQSFLDKHYHVSFRVPPGWELNQKDGRISTFHMDARTAPPKARLRSVALIDFNPFPYSTLAGALFYFSVEPRSTDAECAQQATATPVAEATSSREESAPHKDVQDIAGMPFTHGHTELHGVCIEARDEIYTAWRKHACYRFDLTINTFCPEGSGAQPISESQIHDINERMTKILSTVELGWEKAAPHPIPVPEQPAEPETPKPAAHGTPALRSSGS